MKTNLLKEAVLHLVSTWSLVKLSSIKFSLYALRNSENEMAFFRKHFMVFSSIQDTVKKCYTAKEQKKNVTWKSGQICTCTRNPLLVILIMLRSG